MATLRVRCSSCEKILTVPESGRGKNGKCPNCGQIFRIPQKQPRPGRPDPQPEADDESEEYDDLEEFKDCYRSLPPRMRRKPSGSNESGSRRSDTEKGSLWDFFSGRKQIVRALEEHGVEVGEHYELLKTGIPPLRLWLSNRKGDRWGKVIDPSGNELWVRYRTRLFTSGSALTFYD